MADIDNNNKSTKQAARRPGRSLKNLLYANPLYALSLKGQSPQKLNLVPPAFHPGDPEAGRDLLAGRVSLDHYSITLNDDPWSGLPADATTISRLHSFSWLADLVSLGTAEARALARRWITLWIESHNGWEETTWQPDIMGNRISAWLTAYAFLVGDEDEDDAASFRNNLLRSISMQARHLGRTCSSVSVDSSAFRAIKGLIYAAVCLPGHDNLIVDAMDRLELDMSRQILPDGGHFERNPTLQLDVLTHLIDIRSLLIESHTEVPTTLQGAIDRMAPMLRAMRHGDGGLALFNGSFEGDRTQVDQALAQSEVRGKALTSAPHTGFQRLANGRTVIIVDTGKPPLQKTHLVSHAGTLSFEMSVGKERFIVNCGSQIGKGPQWKNALRATAAHSTLVVDNKNSSELHDDGSLGTGPTHVECQRKESDGATWLDTGHNGYAEAFGLVHKRKFYLEPLGEDLRGEDILEGAGGTAFAIRFHLHPSVHASKAEGRNAVLLKLQGGSGWQFMASGGTISLEEDIYLGKAYEDRRTEQIVITGPLHGDGARIKWRLHKI